MPTAFVSVEECIALANDRGGVDGPGRCGARVGRGNTCGAKVWLDGCCKRHLPKDARGNPVAHKKI